MQLIEQSTIFTIKTRDLDTPPKNNIIMKKVFSFFHG